jgi:predicted ester cyclase
MEADENKAIVLQMTDELRAGTLDALDAHPGMAPMKPFFRQLFAAFPDANVEVKEMLAEGAWVACRLVQRATQRGPWLGVPATGRRAAWEIIATYRLEAGAIVEAHAQADNLGLLRQLGVQGALAAG